MTPSRVRQESLRLGRLESARLAWALAISLAVHLFCYGGYEAGRKFNLWQALHLPDWLQKMTALTVIPKEPRKTPPPDEVPLIYVDVSPHQATTESPKDARYYSSRDSQAANPEADQDTGVPKITGTQTQVPKTEDTPRAPYDKLQPDFSRLNRELPEPKSPTTPGDLAMVRPDATLRPDNSAPQETRPRTIREALTRQNRSQRVGEKMKQDGGVRQHLEMTSLDAKATPFGQYDAEFIEAVQSCWYNLLDNMSYDGYRRGKVTVQFHLNYKGEITDMKVLDNSVGEMLGLLCQKAVLDPAPYERWPSDMRHMAQKDYREIQFTFYYN